MFVKLDGFAPDQDPTTPGILVDCDGIVPSLRGIRAAPGPVDAGVDALAAACQGAAQIRKLDNTSRLFAGTTTALYELSSTSWTDRTRAVGGAYALSSETRWRFAQFGDVTLAVAKTDTLQSSTSGAFANVTGAPKAAIVETVGQFVFLFDTNEATFGDSPNRWWCSALSDYTDWTPAISTQSATNVITSIPGKIRGGKRLGERIVVYKDRGISIGTYTGPAFIWEFADIPGDVGTVSQETIVDLGTAHLFMSHDGFFAFDGVSVTPIDQDIRNWWIERVSKTGIYQSVALHNRDEGLIIWYYPVTGSSTLTEGLVYNYRSGKWGRDNNTVEAVIQYVEPGYTYASFAAAYATYADVPNIPYNSSIFESGAGSPAFFDSLHTIDTLTADAGAWSYTTGDFGDDQQVTFITRLLPRFVSAPSGAVLDNYYRNALGDTLTADASTNMSRSRFDVYRAARWHRGTVSGTGTMEQTGIQVLVQEGGEE